MRVCEFQRIALCEGFHHFCWGSKKINASLKASRDGSHRDAFFARLAATTATRTAAATAATLDARANTHTHTEMHGQPLAV